MGLLGAKLVNSPMDTNSKLMPDQEELLSDPSQYSRLVRRLNYLIVTRPDIVFAMSVVS